MELSKGGSNIQQSMLLFIKENTASRKKMFPSNIANIYVSIFADSLHYWSPMNPCNT